jgi:hypothetical protein
MIRYALQCSQSHAWEAWFPSSDGYDEQVQRGLVDCPICGTKDVRKALMAPAVVSSKSSRPAPPVSVPVALETAAEKSLDVPAPVRAFFEGWRQHVSENYDYVGDKFAAEARAIHEGASEERLIYGDVTPKEARDLIEDGIPVAPLPAMASPEGVKKLS